MEPASSSFSSRRPLLQDDLAGLRHVAVADATFPLSLLPQDTLQVVFRHCSPRDVGRFACVSQGWQAAAESDEAWCDIAPWLLPGNDQDEGNLRKHFPELRDCGNNCKAFGKALLGVHSEDKSWLLRADPNTGHLSLLASVVKHLGIIWYNPAQPTGYWESQPHVPGSDFETCAFLIRVCWFQLGGRLRPPFLLPPGQYKMSWKLGKSPGGFRWQDQPALCSVTLDQHIKVVQEKEVPLAQDGEPYEPYAASVPKGGRPGQSTTAPAKGDSPRPSELAQERGAELQSTDADQNPGFFHMAGNFLLGFGNATRGRAAAGQGSVANDSVEAAAATTEGEGEHSEARGDEGGDHGSENEEQHELPAVSLFSRSSLPLPRRYGIIDRTGPWPGPMHRFRPQPIGVGLFRPHVPAWMGESLKWHLYEVGEFSLEGQEPWQPTALDVEVDLREIRSTWKSGLYVDAVVFSQLAGGSTHQKLKFSAHSK